MRLELPFPPSVNHYWGTRIVGSGKHKFVQRYIGKQGKAFRQEVHELFLVENITEKFEGPLSVTVDLYPPCALRRDVDNYCKGLFDSLGEAGLYDDDSQIKDLRVRMHPKRPPGRCVVTLEQAGDLQTEHSQTSMVV